MTDAQTKRLLLVVLAAVSAAGIIFGLAGYLRGAIPEGSDRHYLRNNGGAVLFDHSRHSAAAGSCVECHHTLASGVTNCGDCHEGAGYAADTAEHGELLEIHGRACDSCHEIAPADEATSCRECHVGDLADVYHRSCSECHLATAPERFTGDAGKPLCRACHLR